MLTAINETNRRRQLQEAYNTRHGITPVSIQKGIQDILASVYEKDYVTVPLAAEDSTPYLLPQDIPRHLARLRKEMQAAAKKLEFERAAELRDQIKNLETAGLRQ
jgi:excinuclease ABC subunit B